MVQNWGYTAEDTAESFSFLDFNKENTLSFREFCIMWPKLCSQQIQRSALRLYSPSQLSCGSFVWINRSICQLGRHILASMTVNAPKAAAQDFQCGENHDARATLPIASRGNCSPSGCHQRDPVCGLQSPKIQKITGKVMIPL